MASIGIISGINDLSLSAMAGVDYVISDNPTVIGYAEQHGVMGIYLDMPVRDRDLDFASHFRTKTVIDGYSAMYSLGVDRARLFWDDRYMWYRSYLENLVVPDEVYITWDLNSTLCTVAMEVFHGCRVIGLQVHGLNDLEAYAYWQLFPASEMRLTHRTGWLEHAGIDITVLETSSNPGLEYEYSHDYNRSFINRYVMGMVFDKRDERELAEVLDAIPSIGIIYCRDGRSEEIVRELVPGRVYSQDMGVLKACQYVVTSRIIDSLYGREGILLIDFNNKNGGKLLNVAEWYGQNVSPLELARASISA